jgi:hypothetical protein
VHSFEASVLKKMKIWIGEQSISICMTFIKRKQWLELNFPPFVLFILYSKNKSKLFVVLRMYHSLSQRMPCSPVWQQKLLWLHITWESVEQIFCNQIHEWVIPIKWCMPCLNDNFYSYTIWLRVRSLYVFVQKLSSFSQRIRTHLELSFA